MLMNYKAKDLERENLQTTPGDRRRKSKTVVQKALGTEFEEVALDLPPTEEIRRPKLFWAPEMAGMRWNLGKTGIFAADLKDLVKRKSAEVGFERRSLDLKGFCVWGRKVGEESIYREEWKWDFQIYP